MKVDAKYEVRYMIKKASGVSRDIDLKLVDKKFNISLPIKGFISKDPELDSHMLEATQATLFPFVKVKGQFFDDHIKAEVEFHGIVKSYELPLKSNGTFASFILDLEAHGVKRPSMLGIKIKNEVLMTFEIS